MILFKFQNKFLKGVNTSMFINVRSLSKNEIDAQMNQRLFFVYMTDPTGFTDRLA